MADRLRLLELCVKECSAAFGWGLLGNCLTCERGYLSFTLLPSATDAGLEYTLSYRYSDFDRLCRELTNVPYYQGLAVATDVQPVGSWTLTGVSTATRRLVAKADRFANALAEKLITPEDNLRFAEYLAERGASAYGRAPDITTERVFTALLTEQYFQAESLCREAIANGCQSALCPAVIAYVKRRL